MASPQKEHGFTPIAHEILEALARQRLAPREWQILMLILRESYGRQTKDARLSLSDISQRTLISKTHCCNALTRLRLLKLVTGSRVTNSGNHLKTVWIFQKDYHQWGVTNSGTVTNSGNGSVTDSGNSPTPPIKDKERKDKQKRSAQKPNETEQEKPYQIPNYKQDPLRAIVHVYKVVKGFPPEDRAWDRLYYPRCLKSAKAMQELFAGDILSAMSCVESLGKHFNDQGLTWTFETVVKHAADWRLKGTHEQHRRDTHRPSVHLPAAKQRTAQGTEKDGGFASSRTILDSIGNMLPVQNKLRSDHGRTGSGDAEDMAGIPKNPLEATED